MDSSYRIQSKSYQKNTTCMLYKPHWCICRIILPPIAWNLMKFNFGAKCDLYGTWDLMKEGDLPGVDNLSSGISVEYNVAVTTIEFAIRISVNFDPTIVFYTPNLKVMRYVYPNQNFLDLILLRGLKIILV